MVAAREDATQAEDDDQEECSAQGEAKGRSRCIHVVGWRKILALHRVLMLLLLQLSPLHSCVRNRGREEFEGERQEKGNLKLRM